MYHFRLLMIKLLVFLSIFCFSLKAAIDQKMLERMNRKQIESFLVQARKNKEEASIIKWLEERLAYLIALESRPKMAPEGVFGPGEWVWRPLGAGTGTWQWASEKGRGVPGTRPGGAAGEIPANEQVGAPEEERNVEQPPAGEEQQGEAPGETEKKEVEKKIILVKDRILPFLTIQEMKSLTEAEKKVSDQIFIEALMTLAAQVFVKPAGEKQRVTVGKSSFNGTPFDAYCFYMKEILIGVGADEAFKSREQLYAIIGEEESPGELFASIEKSLAKKDDESLASFLDRIRRAEFFGQAVSQFLALCAACCFDQDAFITNFGPFMPVLLTNIGVCQRPVVRNVNMTEIVESRIAVVEMFAAWMESLRTWVSTTDNGLNNPNLWNRDFVGELRSNINILRLDPLFLKFEGLLGTSAQEAAEKARSDIEKMKALPLLYQLYFVGYIQTFFGSNPSIATFLDTCKYQLFFTAETNLEEAIRGTLTIKRNELDTLIENVETIIQDNRDTLAGELVDTLESAIVNAQESLTVDSDAAQVQKVVDAFIKTVRARAKEYHEVSLFTGVKSREAIDDYQILRSLFIHYGKQLLEKRRASVDPYELVKTRLEKAKDIKAIVSVVAILEKVVDQKNRLEIIKQELNRTDFEPNADVIIAQFKALFGKEQLAFEDNLKFVIAEYRKKQAKSKVIRDILERAVLLYIQTDKPVGSFIFQEFKQAEKQKKIPVPAKLSSVERTPAMVKTVFDGALGAVVVKTIASVDDFYKMIEPYGLLMTVLKQWVEKAGALEPKDRNKLIFSSLNALNNGVVVVSEDYVPAIVPNANYVKSGAYKGKLTQIIADLTQEQLKEFEEHVRALVAQAGVGAENKQEGKRILKEFVELFARTSFDLLITQLSELNAGSGLVEIPGLPLTGSVAQQRQNLIAYAVFKLLFSELLSYVRPQGESIDPATLDIAKISELTKRLPEEVERLVDMEDRLSSEIRARVKKPLVNFMTTLVDRFTAIVQALAGVSPVSVSPAGPGAVVPGEIPPPPPGKGPPGGPPGGASGPPPPPTGSPPPS